MGQILLTLTGIKNHDQPRLLLINLFLNPSGDDSVGIDFEKIFETKS